MRSPSPNSKNRFGVCSLLVFLLAFSFVWGQQKVEEINNPEQLYLYAAGLMQRNFHDLALPQLKIFLQRYPEHEHAKEAQRLLIHCGHALNRQAETIEGITQFRKRWPKDPLNEQFSLMAAVIHYQQGDFAGALAAYKELSNSANPQFSETGLYYQGQCYLQLKQEAEAFKLLKKLADRPLQINFPYRAYAAFHIAGETLKQGDSKTAIDLYRKIGAGQDLPDEMREKAVLRVADLEYEAKNYAAALSGYEDYILSFPEGDFQQQVRRQRLICAYRLQDFARVAELGQDWQAKYQQADDFELELLLAEALMELKRYEEATALYGKIGRNKKTPEQYRFPALLQELAGLSILEKNQEILQKGQEILEEFPNRPEKGRILFQVGKAAQASKKQDEAEKYLRAATEFFVGEEELFLMAARVLAESLQEGEKWSEAAVVARRISERVPPPLQAAYRLQAAEFEFKRENFAAVREEADLIRQRWPEQKEILLLALQLHINASLSLNEYDSAQENLQLLLTLVEPKARGQIGLLLATVLLRLNRDGEASAIIKQTLALPELEKDLFVELKVLLLRLHLQYDEEAEALSLLEEMFLLPEKEQKEKISPDLWQAAGILLNHQQRYEEAEKALRLSLLGESTAEFQTQSELLLAEILILHNRDQEAGQLLNSIHQRDQQDGKAASAEFASLSAELNLQLKRPDQAFAAAEQCFAANESDNLRALTRARWVMAKLLFEVEKDAKNALPYSIKCFILADDPLYSPKAMELAIAIYRAMNNETDARSTWNELKQRYPVWAAGLQNTALVKNLD